MKIIGYCRVSTELQADEGYSLEAQRQDIRRYCELYNLELTEIVIDEGESASSLNRPGIQKILDIFKSKSDIKGLIVAKLDRLTRSVMDLAFLLEKYFQKYDLISVSEKIDTSSATGRFVLNIIVSVAQYEREAIAERTKRALTVKRGNGERTGNIPYGKRLSADGIHIEDDPGETNIINAVKNMRPVMTYTDICKKLNTAGNYTRNGKPFTISAIHRIANL